MKRRVLASILSMALALSPSMASFAQSASEPSGAEELTVEMENGADEPIQAETENRDGEKDEDTEPVRINDGGVLVIGGVVYETARWNLAGETEAEQEASGRKARAAETGTVTGDYGENLTYSFDSSTGVLTLGGSGDMKDTTGSSSNWPLYPYQSQITSVVIEEGVTSIGDYAFYRCGNLESVSIPESVTRIGRSAFYQCTSLSRIELPKGVTSIGESAFSGCPFERVELPAGISVLEEFVFNGCSKLKEVVIPANLTEIDRCAFQNCNVLSEINLPDGLKKIGDSVFLNCYALTEVVIPDSVTDIGRQAFLQCGGLRKVTLPAGITKVPEEIFQNCPKLEEVTIPDGVIEIGESAFYNCGLTEVELPDSVTAIGEEAFSNCKNLTEIKIPDSVEAIGTNAFRNTAYQESLSENKFTVLGGGLLYLYNGSDAVVTVPEGVVRIADSVFENHEEITEVRLPDSLRGIGASAFAGCSALKTVAVPDGVTAIGQDAFSETPFLEEQEEGLLVLGKTAYTYVGTGEEGTVQIPDGVVSISPYAFLFCGSLEKVVIPDSVTSIGECAFVGCTALTYVKIPASVTEIGEYAVGYYCANGSSGTYLSMPMAIAGYTGTAAQEYGNATSNQVQFLALDELSGVCGDSLAWTLDEASGELVISGDGAMADYTSYGTGASPFAAYQSMITSVKVEEGVTSVGAYAFYQLKKLERVTLPESLTAIGNSAFRDCGKLSSLALPGKVSSVGTNVFSGCSGLQSIEVAAENETYCSESGVLYDKEKTELLAVPESLPLETLQIPDTVRRIENYAAQNNRYLRQIYFPEALNYIGYSSFASCISLKYLVFPGDVPTFGSYSSISTEGISIYCSFSRKGWENKMETLNYPAEKTWVNLDTLSGVQTLTLEAETDTLAVGETQRLSAKLDPTLALEFIWESSAPEIAGVAADGTLQAYRPGEATVSVSSADGRYRAEKRFTVTGEAYQMPETEVTELSEDVLSYTSIGAETVQIPSVQQNGIYFLKGNKLAFYSLATKQSVPVYTFPGCTRSYHTDEKLYVVYQEQCIVYDLMKQRVEQSFMVPGYTATAVGADDSGRIYVAADDSNNRYDHRIFLYTPEGMVLSRMVSGTRVYRFNGFDSTNGNFYVEVYYDYYSWGYSHPGTALRMGNVTDNVIKHVDTYNSFLESGIITRTMDNILYLCQDVYLDHQNSAVLLGGRYLTAVSAMLGVVRVMDSHSESLDICQSFLREPAEYEQESSYYDTSSVGVRTVYREGHDSLILYENGRRLTEYDVQTGKRVAERDTAHYVFDMFWMGETLVLIEKENDVYYLEMADWSDPEEIEVVGEETMQVGESQHLEIRNGKPYTPYYVWSSSDKSVASVSANGDLTAWKAGTAEITVSNISGTLTASHTVTVRESEGEIQAGGILTVQGEATQNISLNNYTVWSKTVNSYLTERENQTLERVEYIRGAGVLVENWSADGKLLASRTLEMPLPLFGGFFAGTDYNFLVFGQENEQESNKCEVMRVVKYSKDWEYLGAYSAYGANTYLPFEAGSLRMAETDGKLYIHTCHEMYLANDGNHHQANMTFVVNETDMTEEQSFYDVSNISQDGYVSHSFTQFVRIDGAYVYRVDHGDGGPRAVALTRADVDGEITDVRYTLPLSIQGGFGANATGVSVGGFELSADNCLIAGNSVEQSDAKTYSAYGQRNIFLTVTAKDLTENKVVWLTDYKEADGITPRTPQLVKLNDWQFLVLWEEYNQNTKDTCTKMATFDGDGNQVSDIVVTDMRLSDCQPVAAGNGMVKWYVTDGSSVQLYTVNPYRLEELSRAETCKDSHTWDEGVVITEASCEEDGIRLYTCQVCGQTRNENIPAQGHYWGAWSEEPSASGEVSRKCYRCGKTETKPYEAGGENENGGNSGAGSEGNGSNGIGEQGSGSENPLKPGTQTVLPEAGTELVTEDGSIYKVTAAGSAVAYTALGNKKAASVVIPSAVTIDGVTYRVTSIAAKAFKGNKTLKKVVIPATVTKIGQKAFYNCKKLQKITIKSTKLTAKKVGSKAFTKAGSSNYKKLKVKVPAKKLTAYKKILRKKGLSKKAKITK